MLNSIIANSYNPQNLTEDELVQGFVARTKVFNDLFSELANSTMKVPEQHFLIQGLRGMGKTTLLRRIDIEVRRNSKLSGWLVPILYREEEYSVGSLSDLWELTAEYLENREPVFDGLYQQILAHRSNSRYEEVAFDTLRYALRQHHKKILLLIDNLGDILAKLSQTEQQRLREILMTQPDIRIVGATSKTLEPIYDVKNAFFGFFKVIHLKALNKAEATDLMQFLAKQYGDENVVKIIEARPERIEIMRRLTGGVTRTMILLYEIFTEGEHGSASSDLTRLVNNVTPLYKHRMDDLPPQQQKIVDILARSWDAATAREIADALRLESKTVSAQLAQLERNDIVTKIETGSKSHLYLLSERFFNIWYLMRFGRKQDQRLLWLVRFLEDFIANDTELLQKRINIHLSAIEAQTIEPQAALYLTEALSSMEIDRALQHSLISLTREYLRKKEPILERDLGLILLLLAKKQYNRTYQLFQDVPELKDRYKPLYYACLYFLKDEYRIEYLRMPPEISETVQDVLTEIKQIAIDYA